MRRRGESCLPVVGDDHALAAREPVVLDHVGGAELVERVRDLVDGRAHMGHGRRNPGLGHDLLGEGLRPLELRGGLRGAERGEPGRAQGIRDAGDQRGLGADHDQVHAEFPGKADNVGGVRGSDLMVRADLGRPGVPGGDVQGRHRGVGGQRQGQGVLTSAGADHEDVHAPQVTRRRYGPRPRHPAGGAPRRPRRTTATGSSRCAGRRSPRSRSRHRRPRGRP